MNETQAVAFVGCTAKTLRNWVKKEYLPERRVGRQCDWTEDELREAAAKAAWNKPLGHIPVVSVAIPVAPPSEAMSTAEERGWKLYLQLLERVDKLNDRLDVFQADFNSDRGAIQARLDRESAFFDEIVAVVNDLNHFVACHLEDEDGVDTEGIAHLAKRAKEREVVLYTQYVKMPVRKDPGEEPTTE
jgi:hypothetical protein